MNYFINDIKPAVVFLRITGDSRLEEVKELFLEYFKSLNIDLSFQNVEEELKDLPGKYGPPGGMLILALVDGKAAGCIALRKISQSICEMKRLYVSDAYRGLGLGKQLITIIMEEAINLDYKYIRLDTLPTMKAAQALYKSFGFYDIEPYIFNPIEGTRFLELELSAKNTKPCNH